VRVRRGKLLKYSGAGMPYLVRLTGRALRDMEAIYEINEADASKGAFAWFNVLAETVYSLERSPERGAAGTTRILTYELDRRLSLDKLFGGQRSRVR